MFTLETVDHHHNHNTSIIIACFSIKWVYFCFFANPKCCCFVSIRSVTLEYIIQTIVPDSSTSNPNRDTIKHRVSQVAHLKLQLILTNEAVENLQMQQLLQSFSLEKGHQLPPGDLL